MDLSDPWPWIFRIYRYRRLRSLSRWSQLGDGSQVRLGDGIERCQVPPAITLAYFAEQSPALQARQRAHNRGPLEADAVIKPCALDKQAFDKLGDGHAKRSWPGHCFAIAPGAAINIEPHHAQHRPKMRDIAINKLVGHHGEMMRHRFHWSGSKRKQRRWFANQRGADLVSSLKDICTQRALSHDSGPPSPMHEPGLACSVAVGATAGHPAPLAAIA